MTPRQQLDGFIKRFTPAVAADARRAMVKLRRLVPGAVELVYDNYNALAIGFAPTERPSEAILSIAIFPRWVTLCFLQGAKLPDPDKRLQGAGSTVRHIRLQPITLLDEPPVRALIRSALSRAKVRIKRSQRRRLIIKSISAKQRPRRPVGGK